VLKATTPVGRVLLDHVHAEGPQVSHIRGTLIASSLANLRELDLFDAYSTLLPEAVRDQLLFAIASSWVPIEAALVHYQTCDQLQLSEEIMHRLGARTAERMSETFLSTILRATRNMGVESLWLALEQHGRYWDRMYRGGRVCVLRAGPKDVVLENYGLPLVQSPFWCSAYLGYMRALGSLFAKVSHVRAVRPREANPNAIAVAGSWV